jgi:hypothetical protein
MVAFLLRAPPVDSPTIYIGADKEHEATDSQWNDDRIEEID